VCAGLSVTEDGEMGGAGVGPGLSRGFCSGGVTEDCREVSRSFPETSFAFAGRGALLMLGKTGLASSDPGLMVSVVLGDVGDGDGDLARRS
jgi:hypothetical protein